MIRRKERSDWSKLHLPEASTRHILIRHKSKNAPMNDSPIKDTLEVTNFGPIAKAKIDLRPLTVFVGPSNTGKSYLAILIYALHRHFSREQRDFMFWYPKGRDSSLTINSLAAWRKNTLTGGKILSGSIITLPSVMRDEIRSILNRRGEHICENIRGCFGMDKTNALIRKGSQEGARIGFQRHASENSVIFKQGLTIKEQLSNVSTEIPEGLQIRFDKSYFQRYMDPMIGLDEDERWYEYFIDCVEPQLFGPLYSRAFYLPADRTGIMHAHSTVVSAIIGNAPMAGLRPDTSTPMLSGVLSDFLQELIALGRGQNRRRRVSKPEHRHNMDEQIEASILDGSVHIDRSGIVGYPHFLYRPKGWKDDLPLIHASSMVSEIAPVVLYLRHLVQPDDTLIIEEPEAHLHPAMQVEFTRQLAALVRAGIRVIVTTHSEWVLEELSNIVRRSKLPESSQKKMPRSDFALHSDQVGVWLFEPKRRPRGSVVREIRLDDAGLYPSEFDEVARALHNDWADISSRIGEAE